MLAETTGLGREPEEEPSTDYDEGSDHGSAAGKGEMVDKNTTISYTVSTGSDKITLPDLENESSRRCRKQHWKSWGLKCDQQEVYDISIAQGHVSYTESGSRKGSCPEFYRYTLHQQRRRRKCRQFRSCIGHGNGYGNTGDSQRDEKETESKETSAKAEYSTDVNFMHRRTTTMRKSALSWCRTARQRLWWTERWLSSRTA